MSQHPILDVFDRITTRAPFVRPRALELFCGAGTMHTKEYAPLCEYVEGWDLKEDRVAEFKRNLPQAKARVCDAFKEIMQPRPAGFPGDYNVIVVDSNFLQAPRFEHFDIFPGIFNVMAPAICFVVFTVCPDPFGYAEPRKDMLQKAYGDRVEDFLKDWDSARDQFYNLTPLDPSNMPKPRPVSSVRLQDMEAIYKDKFEAAGWQVPYTFSCMRAKAVGYVLIEAKREAVSVGQAATDAIKAAKTARSRKASAA